MSKISIQIDGLAVNCCDDRTLFEQALAQNIYIPHLCAHPRLKPFGSCRVCVVKANDRRVAACTYVPGQGDRIVIHDEELFELRKNILSMLFVEGNHYCPGCEMSGNCQLQALAYLHQMHDAFFAYQYPYREKDGSHKTLFLDRDRCIDCGLCVRASEEVDAKAELVLSGRGSNTTLIATSESGRIADTGLDDKDLAANICPVGALIHKQHNYAQPIGQRIYDDQTIDDIGNQFFHPYYDEIINAE